MPEKLPRRLVASSMSVPMRVARRHDAELDPRLADLLDVRDGRQARRVVDVDVAAAVGQRHQVLHRRSGRNEIQVELALQSLLDDLHVEQPQETATEPEAERHGALRLEADRGVVEVKFVQRIAEQRVVRAVDGVDARKDERLGRFVTRQRLVGAGRWPPCQRVADLAVADALEPGRHVADVARAERRRPGPAAAGRRRARGCRSRAPEAISRTRSCSWSVPSASRT